MIFLFRRFMFFLLIFILYSTVFGAQDDQERERAEYIRSHYAKYEYQIPMRDGVKLYTIVYTPYDKSQKYPILLYRTPYGIGPYGSSHYKTKLGPHFAYEKEGFIFVFQDVRGKYMSEGEYVNMRPYIEKKNSPEDIDESTDTYDTIEWLLKHLDNHNGRVGQWGVSYPGFYTTMGLLSRHPALRAASPQAPIADWFWDDMHRHGAFNLILAFDFFANFGQPRPEPTWERPPRFEHHTPDGYKFFLELGPLKNVNEKYFHGKIAFWNDIIAHPNYDEFWQSRNVLPHLKDIKAAVMVVGGWYDSEDLYGPLKTYQSIEQKNPGIFNVLVMGPWSHGGWYWTEGERLADADFGFKTSRWFQENVDLKFFKNFLKDRNDGEMALPEALIFETGANRWREFDHWPPQQVQTSRLYLQPEGNLSFSPPSVSDTSFDEYISDPARPIPYTSTISTRWSKTFYAEDQRFASRRPDVLLYQSEPLSEDLTIAGPLKVKLFVSTTGGDADFVVKLVDVFPDEIPGLEKGDRGWNRGAQELLVRAEPFRGRFRKSYQHPLPFIPNQIDSIAYEMQDVCHTFLRGHRIMIQIQSSWFPFIDRNPQKYVPNIFQASEEDFIKAAVRVYHSSRYPSHLEVKVLPAN